MLVLITGAAGMLGQDLTRVLRDGGHEVEPAAHPDLDVRDGMAVKRVLSSRPFDVVCHLAALTDVDFCEREPVEAYRTNTLGTENLALACREYGIQMLYVSTISVFDGTKAEPYTEYDAPNPQNCYARAKHQGEVLVARFVPEHYIIRAGWMFGGGVLDKKFVARFLERARASSELTAVDDTFGSPTYTVDLSRTITALLETRQFGTYHGVNAGGPVTRYEFAREILESAEVSGVELRAVNSAHFPLAARRPRMEAARNLHFELLGWDPSRDWRDAVREYVHTSLSSLMARRD